MTTDHERSQLPWPLCMIGARPTWLIRVVTGCVLVATAGLFLFASGPVQLVAKLALVAYLLQRGWVQMARVVRDTRAYDWTRLGRFAWMQHAVLTAGLLLMFVVTYVPLAVLYPALQLTPMTSIVVGILMVLLAAAGVASALAVLAALFVLLSLPVLVTRSIVRERRRRHYRHPNQ